MFDCIVGLSPHGLPGACAMHGVPGADLRAQRQRAALPAAARRQLPGVPDELPERAR